MQFRNFKPLTNYQNYKYDQTNLNQIKNALVIIGHSKQEHVQTKKQEN